MKDKAHRAINLIRMKRAQYGDVRFAHVEDEEIEVKNGRPEAVVRRDSLGFGVRVLVDGAWGFAASCRLTSAEIDRVVNEAFRIAHASALVKHSDVRLSDVKPVEASYATPYRIDPSAVPLEQKLNLLLAADAVMRRQKPVKVSQAFMTTYKTAKTFASTEGACIEQEILHCGGGIAATAVKGSEVQVRSYPNSFRGNFATAGYEFIEGMRLPEEAERVADEACKLLTAPQCPDKTTTLILDGGQLALQVHESIGHPIELDRVLGMEASYAGTSFLTLNNVGRLRYGSDLVNVVADATTPGGLGTFGYDDEGVPAQSTPIIRDGIFVGFLSSRETASQTGKTSSGTMRAEDWGKIPLIRMTNVNLLPGEWDFDDLVADTDDGIFMVTNRSWSIDDKRLNFQFGTEVAYEIKKGRLGRMLRNPTYTGITPQFWGSCDAICGQKHWQLWGTPNCGKGEPSQSAHVGHGVAPARFRNVRVGVMK